MTLKNLAKKYDLTEEELTFAFKKLGYIKTNGEVKSNYVKNGMFTEDGGYNYKKEFVEMFDELMVDNIKSYVNEKRIKELEIQVSELNKTVEKQNKEIEKLNKKLDV